MHVFYHPHALLRMEQRKVSKPDVVEVLADPQITRPADQGRTMYIRTLRVGGTLKVVAITGEIRDNEYIVYTVAWKDADEA